MNRLGIIGILCVWILSSCSGDRLYEDFIALDESRGWQQADSLEFQLGDVDHEGKATLIAVKFTETYPFSNFYVRVIAKDSSSQIIENKLVNVPLFDSKTGQPLGKGFGSSYTKYDTLPFGLPAQTKSITLLQYMRQESLPGIEAAGLKIVP